MLTVLNKLLKVAVEWKVVPGLPCRIRLLKTAKPVVEFYEPEQYERLLAAAASTDWRTHVAALLGGDAGLRLGEILGVEWPDLDFARELVKVQRAVYEGEVTLPKGGKPRVIPMTEGSRRRCRSSGTCAATGCSTATTASRRKSGG